MARESNDVGLVELYPSDLSTLHVSVRTRLSHRRKAGGERGSWPVEEGQWKQRGLSILNTTVTVCQLATLQAVTSLPKLGSICRASHPCYARRKKAVAEMETIVGS